MLKKKPIIVKLHKNSTMRYTEGYPPGMWELFVVNGSLTSFGDKYGHGALGTQPEWLQGIVAVGKAGEHGFDMRHCGDGPDFVLWFRVNPDLELVGFGTG